MANALTRYQDKLQQANSRFKKYREGERKMEKLIVAGAVSGITAYGIGYFEQTNPQQMLISGFHASLLFGAVATAAGVMGWLGPESYIAAAAGVGALDAYAFERGVAQGQAHVAAAAQAAQAAPAAA